MRIGIVGVGHIGVTLTQRLSATGHAVKVANSRGPDTIDPAILVSGARAVDAARAAVDVDVLVLSIPLVKIPSVAPLIAEVSVDTVIIDTSNYYPARDGKIDALESGQVESLWVAEQLGRSFGKAFNAIGSDSFAAKVQPPGSPARIAIPVAADNEQDRSVTMALVEETGFDPFYAGTLAESWRQQPGTPAYCTDLTSGEMAGALAAADARRSPLRRDLAVAAIMERLGSATENPDAAYLVASIAPCSCDVTLTGVTRRT